MNTGKDLAEDCKKKLNEVVKLDSQHTRWNVRRP